MTKEEIIQEINRMIDRLEDACGIDQNDTINKLRELLEIL